MGCVRTSTGARARHCHPHHAGHFSVTTSTGAHTREASKSPQQKPARSRQGDGKGAGGQRTDAISLSILSTASSSITVFAVIDRIAVASLVPSSAKTMVASCHKACNTARVEVLFWRPNSVQGCLPNGSPSNPTRSRSRPPDRDGVQHLYAAPSSPYLLLQQGERMPRTLRRERVLHEHHAIETLSLNSDVPVLLVSKTLKLFLILLSFS